MLRLLERAGRAAWWRSAAARSGPSACARRCARHTVVHLEVEPDEAWRRAIGQGPPAGARPRPLRPAARRPRARVYESVADAVLPAGGPRRGPPGAARAAGAARRARGRRGMRLVWARGRVGRLPGVRRPRPDGQPASSTPPTAGASRSPTRTWRATTASRPSTRSRSRRARSTRRSPPPRSCCARWPQAGAERGDVRGGGRRRRGGRPGRLLRRRLPARHARTCRCRPRSSPRSTRPTAARPASTCPRARTTSAPTTSPRP